MTYAESVMLSWSNDAMRRVAARGEGHRRLLPQLLCATCALIFSVRSYPAQQTAAPPELATQWEAPPGDALEHVTAGLAKVLCSALFITGRDLKTALDEDGFFVAPRAE